MTIFPKHFSLFVMAGFDPAIQSFFTRTSFETPSRLILRCERKRASKDGGWAPQDETHTWLDGRLSGGHDDLKI